MVGITVASECGTGIKVASVSAVQGKIQMILSDKLS